MVLRRLAAIALTFAVARCGPPAPAPSGAPTPPLVRVVPVVSAEGPPESPPPAAAAAEPSVAPAAPASAAPPRVVVTCNDCGMKPIPIIHFRYGSTAISAEAEPMLREMAEAMKAHPEITLVAVEGHADLDEGKRIPADISRRRAEAVRERLVAKGIEPGRLVVVARETTMPIDDNATEAGRAHNRRVQLRVEGKRDP